MNYFKALSKWWIIFQKYLNLVYIYRIWKKCMLCVAAYLLFLFLYGIMILNAKATIQKLTVVLGVLKNSIKIALKYISKREKIY